MLATPKVIEIDGCGIYYLSKPVHCLPTGYMPIHYAAVPDYHHYLSLCYRIPAMSIKLLHVEIACSVYLS